MPEITVAFTGTRDTTNKDLKRILSSLREIEKEAGVPHTCITGAAYGIDTMVATAAYSLWPDSVHWLIIPAGWHNENIVKWCSHRDFVLEFMPRHTTYMDRNQVKVDLADVLIAFPKRDGEVLRSETWATVRRARKKGIPIHIFPLVYKEAT